MNTTPFVLFVLMISLELVLILVHSLVCSLEDGLYRIILRSIVSHSEGGRISVPGLGILIAVCLLEYRIEIS